MATKHRIKEKILGKKYYFFYDTYGEAERNRTRHEMIIFDMTEGKYRNVRV